MRAISLKLNKYVKSVSLINNNIEKSLFNFIVWSFGAILILYLVFLGNMVKNIVERRSFEARLGPLSNEVSSLELTYLSMSNNIDLNLAYSMGFKETKINFATRKFIGLRPALDSGTMGATQNDL